MPLIAYLTEYNRYLNIVGIFVVLGISWFFSHNRAKINPKIIVNGLLMQFVIAFFMLKTTTGQWLINCVSRGISQLYEFGHVGASFVFGPLADRAQPWGLSFAFNVLPFIIFFGAFMSILFHFGIVQLLVGGMSRVIRPIFGTSGAETLCAMANSFLGQTEAPLVVRNYLAHMTKSEMLLVMLGGMAHVSGSILVIYATMGVPTPHLLAASVMAIPGSIIIAKMLYPETEKPQTASGAVVEEESPAGNVLSAIAQGTTDGLYLVFNIAAMLIAFLALIALVNALLGQTSICINYLLALIGSTATLPELNLSFFFSYLFAPFGYLLGFSGDEAFKAGNLLGIKLTMNEFVAYGEMVRTNLSPRAVAILTYALCGFANFSSIGIQIGGIGSLVPSRREWLGQLGMLALLGGSLSNLLSALVAALLL